MLKIDKYLNYGRSANGSTIGYVCVQCHDSEELNFLEYRKKNQVF